jgi:hypothetical protein
MPWVPNSAALDALGAPSNAFQRASPTRIASKPTCSRI